jgi:chemotaxis protein MotB
MAEEEVKAPQCEECEECPQCEEGLPGWMATFSDLCTLLMTFFVLLLSFSTMDVIKFKQMAGSMEKAFGYTTEAKGVYENKASTPVTIQLSENENKMLDNMEIGNKIQREIKNMKLDKDVEVEVSEEGVMMRLKGKIAFPPGKAELNKKIFPLIDKVAKILKEHPDYKLKVFGHTDNIPIKSAKYDSNWELSSARAVRVIRILVQKHHINPKRLTAIGYGDTRPLVPNNTPANRAKNRRVEFVFYK